MDGEGPAAGRERKAVNLALQGGGSHGAFTWGVLDRLLEDERLHVAAISGTSAGAMNAVVAAHGLVEGGADGARERLQTFWRAISRAGSFSPFRRPPWAHLPGPWSLFHAPAYYFLELVHRLASPYDLNPLDHNPLRDLLAAHVDFDKVRACDEMEVFIAATNVETGRVRVFERHELDLDVVMASACLPYVFKAVEIDGTPYWDGGYTGNPPLFPFFHGSPSDDVVIVQINPVVREGAPRSAAAIQDRLNEITFNSALLAELRAIDFVRRLRENGRLDPEHYARVHVHMIEARKRMRPLDASTKMNTEWTFLAYLFDIGREAADRWLHAHYDDLGRRSSVDIRQMFSGAGVLPHSRPQGEAAE